MTLYVSSCTAIVPLCVALEQNKCVGTTPTVIGLLLSTASQAKSGQLYFVRPTFASPRQFMPELPVFSNADFALGLTMPY